MTIDMAIYNLISAARQDGSDKAVAIEWGGVGHNDDLDEEINDLKKVIAQELLTTKLEAVKEEQEKIHSLLLDMALDHAKRPQTESNKLASFIVDRLREQYMQALTTMKEEGNK